MEYAIKSRGLLHFNSNFDKTSILVVERYQKSQISKFFKFRLPMKKKTLIFPDFSDFWPSFSQSGITNIFSHLALVSFQDIHMWHILAEFHGFR